VADLGDGRRVIAADRPGFDNHGVSSGTFARLVRTRKNEETRFAATCRPFDSFFTGFARGDDIGRPRR